MPIVTYLAVTAAESRASMPENMAWMSCLFSPYGTGISNIPAALPPGAMLILSDLTPICGHDPMRVAEQLTECVSRLDCCGVLLDFQRQGNDETPAMVEHLLEFPFPVAVSQTYAKELDCPVFLPPPLPHQPITEYLAPWQGREIWLEAALERSAVTVTSKGTSYAPTHQSDTPLPHHEPELCCHYRLDLRSDTAVFTLGRTKEDLDDLLRQAKNFGVTKAVGLYQEFCKH